MNTVLFSELLALARHRDFLGKPMVLDENEEKITHPSENKIIYIRTHNMPSYGYFEQSFEDTDDWYDCWWSLFCKIENGIISHSYIYNGYKVEFDVRELK